MACTASQPRRLNLFDVIERLQGEIPWGSVLDVGTGIQSARWISSLQTSCWTAVSADTDHLEGTRVAVQSAMRADDRFLLGNWADPALLAGEVFDTVLAEYLLGAIEGFAPYFQYNLFARLRPMIGRRLYVIGVDPYVVGRSDSPAGEIVQTVGRFRDACALHASVIPYREYPAEWVVERLEQAKLRIIFARRFPNTYNMSWVDRQLADARTLIERVTDRGLSSALARRMATLRTEASAVAEREGGLAYGHEYLVAAEAI